jgi:hypothetical protein
MTDIKMQRKETYDFCKEALDHLNASGTRFMPGGAFALLNHKQITKAGCQLPFYLFKVA